MKSQSTLKEIKKNVTYTLNGKEIILAPIGKKMRIGWVYKDTGLPPTNKDIEQAEKQHEDRTDN
jgi:ABC-type enterochelin transport system substrate-binding protein